MHRRGARVEMNKKNISAQLPKRCAMCTENLERCKWLRCNGCNDINICVSCATSDTRRHRCLDQHTFTVMFRIHELSIRNDVKHDSRLEKVMNDLGWHTCDQCGNEIPLTSWIRCNECDDFDFCMKCWPKSYVDHCSTVGGVHTFTNVSQRYRLKIAPTCAMLCEDDHVCEMFQLAGVAVSEIKFNHEYDRAYCTTACPERNHTRMHTVWDENWYGATNKLIGYYCPAGWRRFSFYVRNVDFENSVTVYHGTRAGAISKIFQKGLLSRKCQHGYSAAYVSPSITYCAHPRYARVVKMKLGGKIVYAQFVAELRVDLSALQTERKRETLGVGNEETIDPHFPENDGLEILIRKEPDNSYLIQEEGVHMTGVMVRLLDHDPLSDAESWWWTKWKSARYIRNKFYTGLDSDESSDDDEDYGG